MLKLRRPDVCVVCAGELPAGSLAWWDCVTRTVTCASCKAAPAEPDAAEAPRPPIDRGQPGASAAREHRRRESNREARTRSRHPLIGALLLALRRAPQHELAFQQGAEGEQAVAAYLERRTARRPTILLHDRCMPRGHGNIDHIAVAPTGVFVIDAKNIKGKVRVARTLFGGTKLMVAGRERSKLIDGLDRQVGAVRDALAADGVPVQGVLCFTVADLALLGPRKIRGHLLLHRRGLAKRLNADGPLRGAAIDAVAETIAVVFPRA
jgi:Nuclease-related domain